MSKHILDIDVLIIPKGEKFTLPDNVVAYDLITERKYAKHYILEYTDISFEKSDLLILYKDYTRSMKSFDNLFSIIERETGVTKEVIKSKSRVAEAIFARQMFNYLAKKQGLGTLEMIGKQTGINHSTVIHSYKTIEACEQFGSGWRKEQFNKIMEKVEI